MSKGAFKVNGATPTSFDSRSEYRFKGSLRPFLISTDKPRTKYRPDFMEEKWKGLKIYRGKTGNVKEQWFVYYSYLNSATLKYSRFKVYKNINTFDRLEEKEEYAEYLREIVKQALLKGHNPFMDKEQEQEREIAKKEEAMERAQKPFVLEALQQFIKAKTDKKLAPKTIRGYHQFNLDIEGYLIESKQADLYIEDFTQEIIMDFLETASDEAGWSPVTYNNHVNYIKTLIKWFAVRPRNWVDDREYLFGDEGIFYQIERVHTNRIFASSLLQKLKSKVAKIPELDFYCKLIFYSCMRPVEVQNLKVEDVDLSSRTIRIVGKTNFRTIPVSNELFSMLDERNLDKHSAKDYVVGVKGKTGPKYHNKDRYRNMFKPIKTAMNLDHTYTLYGLKHTRVVSLLAGGYSDAEVMNLTGHRDTASFDKYKRELMSQMHNTRLKGDTISW